MRTLNMDEVQEVSGAKPKFLNFIGGAIFGAITGGFMGFFTGGPAGAIAGAGYGAYMGAAGAIIKEGRNGVAETIHPELFVGIKGF